MNFTYWTVIILIIVASSNVLNFIDSIDGEKHKISSRLKLGMACLVGAFATLILINLKNALGA